MDDRSDLPAIRVSDEERERSVVLLRDAVVSGRLTLEEFSERVGRAQLARTDRDLAELTVDLPAHAPARGAGSPCEASCDLLEAGSPGFLGDTGAVVLALAVRHDRARPA